MALNKAQMSVDTLRESVLVEDTPSPRNEQKKSSRDRSGLITVQLDNAEARAYYSRCLQIAGYSFAGFVKDVLQERFGQPHTLSEEEILNLHEHKHI